MRKLSGPVIQPASGKADSLVILLHGYGDSGDGLISLGDEWAPAFPNTAFVAPHAPEICEMWSQGYQWFGLRANQDGSVSAKGERKDVIRAPAADLNGYIDEQLALWGVDESKLVVAGFSQGAMMALYTMPLRKKACAGVIEYSGMLVDPEGLLAPDIVKMPILVIHGDRDEVVVPQHFHDAGKGLSAAGFDSEGLLSSGLGHSIDYNGFSKGQEFIKKVLEQ